MLKVFRFLAMCTISCCICDLFDRVGADIYDVSTSPARSATYAKRRAPSVRARASAAGPTQVVSPMVSR